MESTPVKFREWSLWIIGVLGFSGITVSSFSAWFALAVPRLSWVVDPVSVPWIGLLAGGVLTCLGSYTVGKVRSKPVRVDGPKPPSVKPAFEPDAVQCEIIRLLRFADTPVTFDDLIKAIVKGEPKISSRELELGAKSLVVAGWIERKNVWNGRDYEPGAELSERGMAYAKERGFPHRRLHT